LVVLEASSSESAKPERLAAPLAPTATEGSQAGRIPESLEVS
jgi:hypothetical protein